jgi:maleate cis-trans isomerase
MTSAPKLLLVVPANNTTMEPEIRALCPEIGELLMAKVARPPRTLTAQDLPAYCAATIAAVAPFAQAQVDLAVYGCTAAGFLAGPEGNADIASKISARVNAPVVSTTDAMVAALRESKVHSTTILTPYLASVNDGLMGYLRASGIAVERLESFLCETTEALGRITEAQVMERALSTVTLRSQALFIACSQLPTLRIITPLHRQFSIPVWSSISATAWAATHMLASARLSTSPV